QEVRGAARPGLGLVGAAARHVVAGLGVVQRELHEPGERHRAVAADLAADPLEQVRVALRQGRGRIELRDAPEPDLDAGIRLALAAHRRRSRASRTPGPTMVWPPRS